MGVKETRVGRNQQNMLLQNTMTAEFKQPKGSSEYVIGLNKSPYLKNTNPHGELSNSPNVKISLPVQDEQGMSFGSGKKDCGSFQRESFIKVRSNSRNKSSDKNDFSVNVATLLSL